MIKINLWENAQVASVLASNIRSPEDTLALVLLACLILAAGYATCAYRARRRGLTLREWWEQTR